MLTFRSYLMLLESKVDDLEQQNPNIPVRQYATHDNTPTKKFLPWLVKQHKLGNVTPDHPDLTNTLSNFDKYKSKHGITDHTQHSFQELADAVKPHIGTAATNKEKQKQEVDSGVETIHTEPNGISAQYIKTKEASQNLYGGGLGRGGEIGGARGTNWCVSARSDNCLFNSEKYGKMYTIHDPNDPNAPYGVHPQNNRITSRYNDGDQHTDNFLKENPHLTNAINKINAHYIKNITPYDTIKHNLKTSPGKITSDDLTQILTKENNDTDRTQYLRKLALSHPALKPDHIEHILKTSNEDNDPGGELRALALLRR